MEHKFACYFLLFLLLDQFLLCTLILTLLERAILIDFINKSEIIIIVKFKKKTVGISLKINC